MSAPLLFRAWNTRTKKMHEGNIELIQWKDGSMSIDLDGWSDSDYRPILMQWTGLKDRNGKEIYEGDIVDVFSHDHWADKEGTHHIWKVSWSEQFSGWNPPDFEDGWYEVVGNIYSHPELLTGGK